MRSASVFLALITDTGSASLEPLHETTAEKGQVRFLLCECRKRSRTAVQGPPAYCTSDPDDGLLQKCWRLLVMSSRTCAPKEQRTDWLRLKAVTSQFTEVSSRGLISYPSVRPWVQIPIGENNVAGCWEGWTQWREIQCNKSDHTSRHVIYFHILLY